MNQIRPEPIFKIEPRVKGPVQRKVASLALGAVGKLLSLDRLEDIYAKAHGPEDRKEFLARVLREMGITCPVSGEQLERVPSKGPVVLVANHPFGGLEGIVLAHLLLKIRPDVKIMANYLLGRIPELKDLFIFVDPFESSRAVENNLRPLRESIRWVKNGGLLAVFPAGEVAHLDLKARRITDPPWSPVAARIAVKAGASVTPVYFQGNNSVLFQVMGTVHPRLRTAMLPRELDNKSGRPINLHIGGPIKPNRFKRFKDLHSLTEYLRWRTYVLKRANAKKTLIKVAARIRRPPKQAVIAPARSRGLLDQEVRTLPEDQLLLEQGGYKVFFAQRDQIPNLIQEVGRLRELSFRQVGEGTGHALDLDRFDDYYHHLCLWDHEKGALAGAYRLGLADEILDRYGKKGLYTNTLFKFKRGFFEQVSPAVELGRSFVHPDYQRSFSALMLLWKGIGQFVLKHPGYRFLFGPVSISNEYRPICRQMLVDFLSMHLASDAAPLVAPRNPPRFGLGKGGWVRGQIKGMRDISELSEVIVDLQGQGWGVPVLVKQYLKLSSRSAGCNVDPDFGNAIDCLLVSDLTEVDEKTMKRYMGAEGFEAFRYNLKEIYQGRMTRYA